MGCDGRIVARRRSEGTWPETKADPLRGPEQTELPGSDQKSLRVRQKFSEVQTMASYSNIRDFGISNRFSGWMREPTKPKTYMNDPVVGISNADVRRTRNDEDDLDSCRDQGPRRQANLPSKLLRQGPPFVPDDEASTEEGNSSTEEGQVVAGEADADSSAVSFEDTLLIFDWDDTVLPSSWVVRSSEVLPHHRKQLFEVATAAAETLRLAKQLGTVVIITNAERGWIELSCQKFLPTLYPALESVKVLSARTTYESSTLASALPALMMCRAAHRLGLRKCRRKNVLSLGDSVHEREALRRATLHLPGCWSKCLKFVERPDISKICHQHALVCNHFERLVQHADNLDYSIRC
ncbi:hypothetical protein AK812_SmicGene24364 [Symbiodinium microadriaticum]|uniref:Uncharacterized protein n=1 Tax=Symbiodinium microadriaticum TaxID=2951 RepID=A0A1Q9DEQ5_SYMMI|nr:hypothetical protein AK812_SmicGene24364 [Symbiodinium microadriaticum]